jgi:predicted RecA/RadA family phage recombinase
MNAIYKMSGDIVNLAAGSARTGGEVVIVNDILSVCISDAPATQVCSAYVKGIFEFTTAATIAAGDPVYYAVSTDTITKTDTDLYAGRAVAANTGTKVLVSINFMPEVVGS